MRACRNAIAGAAIVAALLTVGIVLALPQDNAPKSAMEKSLERLKGLAGEWTQETPEGTFRVSYRVTAGGSVVLETLAPGEPHEMLTLYHMDRDDLVLTHYCMLGNQPRMKAAPTSSPDRIVFEFSGGGNMRSERDPHMHGARLQFIDKDHLRCEWDYYSGGKKMDTKVFELRRVGTGT